MSALDFLNYVAPELKQNLDIPEEPKKSQVGDLSAGFQTAVGSTLPTLKGAVGYLGAVAENIFGTDGLSTAIKNYGLKGYQEGMQELAPLQRDNIDQAWAKAKEGDLGALVDFAQYAFGYGLGEIAQTAGTAVAGGLIGSAVAPGAGTVGGAIAGATGRKATLEIAESFIGDLVKKELAQNAAARLGKDATQEAIELAVKQADNAAIAMASKSVAKDLGETAALSAFNFGRTTGGIYGEAEQEAKENGETLGGADLARIFGASVVSSLVETGVDKLGIGALKGNLTIPGTGRAGSAFAGAGLGAAAESLTETVQTGVERFGAGKELFSDEAFSEYRNAAAMGAFPGATVGGIAGALNPSPPRTPDPINVDPDSPKALADQIMNSGADIDTIVQAAQAENDKLMEGLSELGEVQAMINVENKRADAFERVRLDIEENAMGDRVPTAQDVVRQLDLEERTGRMPEAGPRILRVGLEPLAAEQALAVERELNPDMKVQLSMGDNGRINVIASPIELPKPAAKPADVSSQEANARIESAAMAAPRVDPEEQGRQELITRTMQNIESRGGVASQYEADVLGEANLGQPYNRIDPSIGRPASVDQKLTAATGIAVGEEAGLGFGARESTRQGAINANAPFRYSPDLQGNKRREQPPVQIPQSASSEVRSVGGIILKASAKRTGNTLDLGDGRTATLVDPTTLTDKVTVQKGANGETRQTLTRGQFATLQKVASIFGKDIALFEGTDDDGFALPSENRKTIYLNKSGNIKATSVALHETLHLLKEDNPEIYRALANVVSAQAGARQKENFRRYYNGQALLGQDEAFDEAGFDNTGFEEGGLYEEELVADTFGSILEKPEMLTDVIREINKNPNRSLAQALTEKFLALFNKVVTALSNSFVTGDFATVGNFVGTTPEQLDALKAAVRQAAVEYGKLQKLEPVQVQGRILKAQGELRLTGRDPNTLGTFPDERAARNEMTVRGEKDFRVEPSGQGVVAKKAVGPVKPEGFVPNAVARYSKARVIFEVAPDPNDLGLKAKWDAYDQIEKTRISKEVLTEVMPFVAKAAGLNPEEVTDQIGGYLDDSNPSFTAVFDKQKLSLGKVLRLTKLAGFALSQDSMMVVADKPFDGSFETGFITLTLPTNVDPSSIDDVHEVYKQLRALDPESIQGHTTVGNEMGLAVPADKMQGILQKIRALPDVTFPDMDNSIRHMAFPSKEEYDYGSSTGNNGTGSELAAERQAGADLRARADQALRAAFERRNLEPKVPRSSVPIRDKDGIYVRRKLGLIAEPSGRNINKVRQIAEAFDRYLTRMSNLPVIERDNFSNEARDEIAAAIADEIAYQTQGGNTGLGWYSNNYPNSLKKLAKRFPELKTNDNARMIFSAFVAITSNGENVAVNASNAVRLYSEYRQGTPVSELDINSRRADGMRDGMLALDKLLREMPLGQIRDYLLSELTVKEMNAELRARGEKPDGSYKADTKVPRSAVIFGPKIGAFFANLMGSEGYLTMDLWWTRSINRMRGLLIPSPTEASIDSLRQMLSMPDATESEVIEAARPYRDTYEANNFKSDLELIMGRKEGKNDEEKKAFNEEAAEKLGKDYPELYRLNRLQKAANTVLKNEDIINEAPENASDREFMYGIARKAQEQLKQNAELDLSLADIQAALWYYEKKLYEAMSGKTAKDIGYDEAISRLGDSGTPSEATRKFKKSDKEGQAKFSPQRTIEEIKAYAADLNEDFFRTPTITDTKDAVEIGRRLGLNIRRRDNVDQRPHVRELYVVDFEGGREAYITVSRRDVDLGLSEGDVYINVGGLESGDQGSRVYMAAGALAFNRSLRLVGDPDGITEAGKRRRLENMITLGLKYGTTNFFAPHKDMLGWNGLQWRGSDDQKLALMLQSSYAVSSRLVPEIKNVKFEENTGTFRRIDDQSRVPISAFADMASQARERTPLANRDGMPGSGTLRLGIIYKSLASLADTAFTDTAGLRPELREERTAALRDSISRIRASTARSPLGFYSKLAKSVSEAPKSLKTGTQWAQWVTGGKLRELGVKQDEIEWSGLVDYLKLRDKETTTLADVQDYLNSNGVQVEEVGLRDMEYLESETATIAAKYGYEVERYGEEMWFQDTDGEIVEFEDLPEDMQSELQNYQSTEPTKYQDYRTPGGTNYREVLLTLPVTEKVPQRKLWLLVEASTGEAVSSRASEPTQSWLDKEASGEYRIETQMVTDAQAADRQGIKGYKSPHWNQTNVLAHIRLQDFTDSTGAKVLFVEELQSDWGQDGKKKGFAKPETDRMQGEAVQQDDGSWAVNWPDGTFSGGYSEQSARQKAKDGKGNAQPGLPSAPFVTDTKGWLGLGLKRVITMAVQEGYDKVAFINGQQSADRYDLSKQVDSIAVNKVYGGEYAVNAYRDDETVTSKVVKNETELADLIGKDPAQKLFKQLESDTYAEIKGSDLKVGGSGMVAFYDKIVPQEVRSLIKKFDGVMGPVSLDMNSKKSGYEWMRETRMANGMNDNQWNNLIGMQKQALIDEYKKQNPVPANVQQGFTVNDKMKSVVKSEGLPLFSRNRTPEFKRWFGDSKVVDENGEPMVVYHGTGVDTNVIKPASELTDYGLAGIYFAKKPNYASSYATLRSPDGGASVYPVYLRIEKPLYLDADENIELTPIGRQLARFVGLFDKRVKRIAETDRAISEAKFDSARALYPQHKKWLKENGYDGVIAQYENGNVSYIVLDSTQIKSAIGNNGEYDPTNPDIRRSSRRAQLMDDLAYKLQDKYIDLKRVQESIVANSGELDDTINAYQKEELYHGRAAKQSQDFLNNQLNPLLQEMRARKVGLEEFETYLWNRFAQERNAQIAKVNPRLPDGGSGITNADAQAYLANLPNDKRTAFEALAKRVDQITRDNLKMSVDAGLEKKESADAMRSAYPNYVPLMRDESPAGTGSGFAVRGPTFKRAIGSNKPVVDILSNLIDQREKIISRAEKANVGRALMGLALKNPDDNMWFVFDPLLNRDPAQRDELRDQLINLGMDPDLADDVSEQPYEEYMGPAGKVLRRPNQKLKQVPNAVAVRVDGEDKFVVFNQNNPQAKRMAEALSNLDAPTLDGALGLVGKFSRYFASINTQYNPVFGVVNLLRDTQGALLNLSSTKLAGEQKAVGAGIMPAIKAIYQVTRARRSGGVVSGPWADLYEKFQSMGAQTGFRDMFASAKERSEKQLQSVLNPTKFDKLTQASRELIFDWLSDYNETLENAVRLSAFKTALDKGMSDEQAASVAKNLTVNFNRKGQIGAQAGAVYAFYNASMQGSARLIETMKGPAGRKIALGGVLIGVAQPMLLAMAGFDDEEPPEYIRERNIVIPTGGTNYITIPMPLGLHVIPNVGRIIMEQMMGRTQDSKTESFIKFGNIVLDSFNPIGSSTFLQTLSPTILDPAVALAENKDFSGKPIAREDFNPSKPTPGYTRAKDNSIEWLTALSEGLNWVTGGSDYTKGFVSPTPDQLEYLIGQFTGGVGREVSKLVQTVETSVTGEELPSYKVPLLGRFYGDSSSQSSEAGQFYVNLSAMNDHKLELTGRVKDGLGTMDYIKENPEAALYRQAERVERQVQELRKLKRTLKEREADPEQIEQLEQRITDVMMRFNETVAARRRVEVE